MTILYFTSTGNSLHLAKKIGGAQLSIPQMIKQNKYHFEDDAIGFIFPTYGFGLPKLVKSFLEKVTINAKYVFAVGVYGNKPGAVMFNLNKLAESRGFKIDYANTLLTVDNYLPLFDPLQQTAALPKKKTAENIEKIVADIHSRKILQPTASIGNRIITAIIHSLELNSKFIINENCTQCGVCATLCPVSNIAVANKVNFSNNCEFCLGCIHHCPQNAIHLKNEKSSARYRNADVTLKEIISANGQLNR